MVSLTTTDIAVILIFFAVVMAIGFISGRKIKSDSESYLLGGRNLGLVLFVLTNVATWYGGILGVGEFTYRYGLLSWFTQGFPYYIFAILFAFFLAPKIREASLFTIPDKITEIYGRYPGIASAFLVFVLVSPAPYILMIGSLISIIFGIELLPALIIGAIVSSVYLFRGGYRSDVYTDVFEFFIMFAGFIILLILLVLNFGGLDYLVASLPENHLKLTGDASPTFILVWFLIALWTFTDPGFHQRSYAAKTPQIAKRGILISVFFWMLFDFLTASTGLYSRALLPDLTNPVMAFPLLAEETLSSGLKGIFYAALLATIISTLQSYLFISATTFGRDFVFKISSAKNLPIKKYTQIGLIVALILGTCLAYLLPSVIAIWYTLGSLVIPGLIFAVLGAYYPRFRVSGSIILAEMLAGFLSSGIWLLIGNTLAETHPLHVVEPMLIGLTVVLLIHLYGLLRVKNKI